jgi:hypothetical protein
MDQVIGPEERFTEIERSAVEALLGGDQPALQILRNQFAKSRVKHREMTGVGFFTYFDIPNTAERAPVPSRMVLDDVLGTVDGLQHGAGFVLFIVGGSLQMLEGFTYDENWPSEIRNFSLRYRSSPRDLTSLLGRPA